MPPDEVRMRLSSKAVVGFRILGLRVGSVPSVAVVHGTEDLLEYALCLLFFQLGPRL